MGFNSAFKGLKCNKVHDLNYITSVANSLFQCRLS